MRVRRRRAQHLGITLGLVPVALAGFVGVRPDHAGLPLPGPMNVGHQDITCAGCHLPAPGDTRQQAQAVVRWHLGRRAQPAYFGTLPVDNQACLGCHERDDDRHPIYRFAEPRFADARAQIGADQCVACHREHQGVRVTAAPTICSSCHEDTDLVDDPLDITHTKLIAAERWDTCLGCHDFHGNHPFEPPTRIDEALPPAAIESYLSGRAQLYSSPEAKRHIAPASRPEATSAP